MAILNKNFPSNITEYPNSFQRQGAFPLEKFSVFYPVAAEDNDGVALTAAQAARKYAETNPLAYVGQVVAAVESDNNVIVYSISSTAGELDELAKASSLGAALESLSGLAERIKAVEDAGYATADDVSTAKQEAIDAAIKAILTDGTANDEIADAYDTIKEIAEWIASDNTASTQILARIKAIEDNYLKGADKTELSEDIAELSDYVGSLPEGATSTTVVDYINEVVNSLAIGDYAKAKDLADLVEIVGSLAGTVSENNTKIGDIAAFLGNPSTDDTLAALLDTKVNKEAGSRLINQDEIAKLAKLSITDGELGISGTVSAGQVTGLPEAIKEIFEATSDEDSTNDQLAKVINTTHLSDNLVELITNPVRKVKAGDEDAVAVTDQTLKFSDEFTVVEEKVTVNALNVNKLAQTDGEWLILNGGNSSLDWE